MVKVTVETIAREANVSIGTVDRALNNRGRISEKTYRKVMETAQRLGYRPNKLASALGRQRRLCIAAITPRNPGYFYRIIKRGMDDAVRETMDFGLDLDQITCDSLSLEDQKSVLLGLDLSKYDGIVLNAGDDGLIPYIDDIVDAGIPVVTFNSDAKDSKRLCFVGENSTQSGLMAGDMMGRLLGGQGKVAVMTSFFHVGAAMERRNGFLRALERYPEVLVVEDVEYSDDEEKAMHKVRALMSRYPDLDGIFANSAIGCYAMGKVVSELRPAKKPVLIGYDVTEPVEEYLKNGILDMVIDQEPHRQSYLAIMLMYRHLTECWVPQEDRVVVHTHMVMRYNAENYASLRSM